MKKNSFILSRLFLYVLVGVLVLGVNNCTSDNQDGSVSSTRTPLPSQVIELSATNPSTISAHPVMTSTKLSPTANPTWTALPTIQPDNIDSFVKSMEDKCELPCWGNITPGKTSELEAKHIVSSFGTIIESTSLYLDYHQKVAVIDFTYKDGKVTSINLPPELTESYELNDLLDQFGLPEDVRMEVIPETADGTSWFYLAVYYPQEGVLAVFSGEGKIKDSKVNACFANTSPDLYLVASDQYSLEQMDNVLDRTLQNILEPLGSITEINKEQFYKLYSKTTEPCLATIVKVP